MSPSEKIRRWIALRRLNDSEFARLSSIPTSYLSRLWAGKSRLTLRQAVRAAHAMHVSLDWLVDDRLGWPPPRPDDRVVLTAAETNVLRLAREVSRHDPELTEAWRRILCVGYAPVGLPAVAVTEPPTAAGSQANGRPEPLGRTAGQIADEAQARRAPPLRGIMRRSS